MMENILGKLKYLLLIVMCSLYLVPAYAYLDPGSGSLIIQAILGGIAGLFVIVKIYWHRLIVWMKRSKGQNLKDQKNDDES